LFWTNDDGVFVLPQRDVAPEHYVQLATPQERHESPPAGKSLTVASRAQCAPRPGFGVQGGRSSVVITDLSLNHYKVN
jgi:hypothetical protein